MKKVYLMLINLIPILLMVGLIPIIQNDFFLTIVYVVIIGIALVIGYQKKDWIFFLFGFCIMTLSECFFISTGVEVFQGNSLFGLIPLWLPFLWAYGFVAIRHGNAILEDNITIHNS
ncbi:MAG: DUF2878 family protein [Candidatus Gracilibacteria bacterium]|nr:DUF2878 family protein [Candidatus Gracilibacteria bacterium]